MKTLRIISLISIVLATEWLIGCCECPSELPANHYHCELYVEPLNNGGRDPVVQTTGIISREAFGLRISLNRSVDLCQRPRTSLFTGAMATSCNCGGENSEAYNAPDSLVIITVNTLDDTHPAGSDVTDLFFGRKFSDYYPAQDFFTEEQFIDYNSSNPLENRTSDLLLMKIPDSGIHQFEVTVYLSDSSVLEIITDPIELQ